MGEKERGTLEGEERQTQQAGSGERAARPREAGAQRAGGGGDDDGDPEAMATNLNSSKSNIYRTAGPDEGGDVDDDGPPEAMATNLNSSRSNVYRTGGPAGDDDDDLDEAAINNTKSNIKNLTAAEPGGGEAGIAVSDPGMPADKPKTK